MERAGELEITHWLRLLRRRSKVVAGVLLVLGSVGLAAALLRPTTYTGSAEVLLRGVQSSEGAASNAGASSEVAVLARSDAVRDAARAASPQASSLAVTVDRDSTIARFSAVARTARLAAQDANAYANAFLAVSGQVRGRQYATAQSTLQTKLSALDATLRGTRLDSRQRGLLLARRAAYLKALNGLTLSGDLAASGGPTILSQARPEQAQASGGRVATAALFLLAGLVLGVVAAGAVDALDDVLRSPEDLDTVADRLDLAKRSRLVMLGQRKRHRGLADERQTSHAYTALRTSLDPELGPSGGLVVVTELLPGSGSLAPAAQLARAFARNGRRVLLVSFDPGQPVNVDGVSALLSGKAPAPADPTGQPSQQGRTVPVPNEDRLAVLTSSVQPGKPDSVESRAPVGMLRDLRSRVDALVVVAPALLTSSKALELSAGGDHTVLVTRLGSTRAGDVDDAVERLTHGKGRSVSLLLMDDSGQQPLAWVGCMTEEVAPLHPATGPDPGLRAVDGVADEPQPEPGQRFLRG